MVFRSFGLMEPTVPFPGLHLSLIHPRRPEVFAKSYLRW
jgi:hypothetical protein